MAKLLESYNNEDVIICDISRVWYLGTFLFLLWFGSIYGQSTIREHDTWHNLRGEINILCQNREPSMVVLVWC